MDEKMKAAFEQQFDGWWEKTAQEAVEWVLEYLRSRQEPVGVAVGQKLYTHPIPSAPAVPEGCELVVLNAEPYGWRYAVQQAVDLLRAIERDGKLRQGGEQYPNAFNCIESVHRLTAMLAAAPSPEKKENT